MSRPLVDDIHSRPDTAAVAAGGAGAASSARRLAATAFAGAVLAFALPMGAVSNCDGEEVRFSGLELVTASVPPSESAPGTLHEDVERHASVFAVAALLACFLGLAFGLAGRAGGGAWASTGLIATQLLGGAILLTGTAGGSLLAGYWLLLLLLGVAGIAYLRVAARRRRLSGRRVRRYVLGQCCLALSPALAVAVLIAIAVVADA
jgi:hypothetical protein